ncbi:MAG TPA: hypothetical protein VGM84_13175 [Steroidobacteraceae bacterium]
MARINYSNIKRQKEATRKQRQQSKLDRRVRKDSEDPAATPTGVPATSTSVGPSDNATK